ncbi:hypothetical protein D3C83_132040 [compost metagenome]
MPSLSPTTRGVTTKPTGSSLAGSRPTVLALPARTLVPGSYDLVLETRPATGRPLLELGFEALRAD